MQRRPLPSLLYKSFFYGCNIACLTFSLFLLRNSGNPAAVCLLEDDISDQLKQQIAVEMNISETAFLTRLHGDQGYEPGKIGLKTFIFKIYWEVSIDNELCIKHKIDKSIFYLRICETFFFMFFPASYPWRDTSGCFTNGHSFSLRWFTPTTEVKSIINIKGDKQL